MAKVEKAFVILMSEEYTNGSTLYWAGYNKPQKKGLAWTSFREDAIRFKRKKKAEKRIKKFLKDHCREAQFSLEKIYFDWAEYNEPKGRK